MKLKLDFLNKIPKQAKDNEIILVKDKATKKILLKSSNKSFTRCAFRPSPPPPTPTSICNGQAD